MLQKAVYVCVSWVNDTHNSSLKSSVVIDGNLTTYCTLTLYFKDGFEINESRRFSFRHVQPQTDSKFIRESHGTHVCTYGMHTNADTCMHGLKHRCQAAFVVLLHFDLSGSM